MVDIPDSLDNLESSTDSDVKVPAFSPLTANGPETVISSEGSLSSRTEDRSTESYPSPQLTAALFPEDSSPDAQLSPEGLMLEHFRIESRIGAGGMGSVFKAYDTRLDRTVAVKVLSPEQANDPATVERFRNEAKATARLDHENIARVYFYGEDKGVRFIAYEYVIGPNLREILTRKGILSPDEAVNYTLQIASAIQHASDAGVIHRDIKPSNIIITPSGRAKLVDLGLARKQLSQQSGELTIAGTTLGTFDYISPEQAKDPRSVDIRSDIYSLGCTLYHLLTGEPPYAEGTVLQKLLDHREKSPPDPSHKNPQIPQLLSSVVQKMMASDPKNRYPTAHALIKQLMHVSGQLGLKTVGPDGFVWTAVLKDERKFWERHLGWLLTSTLLFVIVVLVDRIPVLFPSSSERNSQTNLRKFSPNLKEDRKSGSNEPLEPKRNNGLESNSHEKQSPAKLTAKSDSPNKKISSNGPEVGTSSILSRLIESFSSDEEKGVSGFSKFLSVLGFTDDSLSKMKTGDVQGSDSREEIVIVRDGENRPFPSLEAACTAAKDGDVILLKYNGQRLDDANLPVKEFPINIRNKKIAIRAADGYFPLIEFESQTLGEQDRTFRMVNLNHGALELFNVEIVLRVNPPIENAWNTRWVLFSLHGDDRVFLQGVNISVIGSDSTAIASIVELGPKSPVDLANITKRKGESSNSRLRPEIQLERCFVRGYCSLLSDARYSGFRLEIENSAIAIDGSVVEMKTAETVKPNEDRIVEIDLEQVTCLARKGLLSQSQQSENDDDFPYVQITARGNIFEIQPLESLLSSTGSASLSDLRRRISWNGGQNYYSSIGSFWKLTQTRAPNIEKEMNFEEWKQHWSEREGDLDAHNDDIDWESNWQSLSTSQIGLRHLALDHVVPPLSNPALTGASDGKSVGARLADLHSFLDEPSAKKTESNGSTSTDDK